MARSPIERLLGRAPSEVRLVLPIALVAAVAFLAAAVGIGVPSLPDAHVAVDEQQYYLSALSLVEDANLDISDEIAEQRWRSFTDVLPEEQAVVRPDGARISPHDPLLTVLIAVPTAIGGWVAAKLVMALLAAALAALTVWVAVRRLGVDRRLAAVGVGLASASAPLAVYGQQLYPELPAALTVLIAVSALTAPPDRRALALLVVALVALPWLSVKFVPVGAVLALAAALRWWRVGNRSGALAFGSVLVMAGLGYLVAHHWIWGGWTVYASKERLPSEMAVIGADPDWLARVPLLAGLLVDRAYGIAHWQPGWFLLVPAVAAVLAVGRKAPRVLLAPLAVGWLVAGLLAITIHGFWFPGRQLVVVLPLALLCVLWWVDRGGRMLRAAALGLGAMGVLNYAGLVGAGYFGTATWAVHFVDAASPFYQLLRWASPTYREPLGPAHLPVLALLAVLVVLAWRTARRDADRRGFVVPVSPAAGTVEPSTATPPGAG